MDTAVRSCNPSAGSQKLEDPKSSLASNSHRKMTSQASGSVSDTFSSKQGKSNMLNRTPDVLWQMFEQVRTTVLTQAHTPTCRKEAMGSNPISLLFLPPAPE